MSAVGLDLKVKTPERRKAEQGQGIIMQVAPGLHLSRCQVTISDIYLVRYGAVRQLAQETDCTNILH